MDKKEEPEKMSTEISIEDITKSATQIVETAINADHFILSDFLTEVYNEARLLDDYLRRKDVNIDDADTDTLKKISIMYAVLHVITVFTDKLRKVRKEKMDKEKTDEELDLIIDEEMNNNITIN